MVNPHAGRASVSKQKKRISIRGARVHNLKNVSVDIPRNRLVVITGPSGSGKSSLAFDTLYAEGQRQYIESLSVYSRQFFHQLERPDVDMIEGLQPTISINQHTGIHNPRSTVGTVTEIYDYLRLLYARLGTASCPKCGRLIRPLVPEQIVDALMALGEGTRLILMAPIVRGRKGSHQEIFALIRKAGYVRVRVDGKILDMDNVPELDRHKHHFIEAVVDRIVIRESSRERISESVHMAVRHGGGLALATIEHVLPTGNVWRDRLFSTKNACPTCNIGFDSLEPRMFSFNSPYGICKVCEGFGYLEKFDPDLVLPNRALSLASGAVEAWSKLPEATLKKFRSRMALCLAVLGIRWNTPLNKLNEAEFDFLLYGSKSDLYKVEDAARSGYLGKEKMTLFAEEQKDAVLKGAFKPLMSELIDGDDAIKRYESPEGNLLEDEEDFGRKEKKVSEKKQVVKPKSVDVLEKEEGESAEEETLSSIHLRGGNVLDVEADAAEFLENMDDSLISCGLTNLVNASRSSVCRRLPEPGENVEGIFDIINEEYQKGATGAFRLSLEACRGRIKCPECHGARLREEARCVKIGNFEKRQKDQEKEGEDFYRPRAIHEVTQMSVEEILSFFSGMKFDENEEMPIAEPIISQIIPRLEFLVQVGLGYLTLDRAADTLSGGELQRVHLAGGLGSGLVGVCYILDEPSIGLHPRDNQRLIDTLRNLQQMDNTVLVVEHDEAIMRQADWIIDVGPGAGRHGGMIVAEGTPEDIQNHPSSLTGKYLRRSKNEVNGNGVGEDDAEPVRDGECFRGRERRKPRKFTRGKCITLEHVTTNNLKDVTVDFPLGVFVCVTGVSGSGKSSLVNETLAPALIRKLGGSSVKPGPHGGLKGANRIDKVVLVDQTPIGRTPRSNPATYIGVFDEIRKVFTGTREAKQRGYKVGRFSFNVKGGRCEHCQGQGVQKIEMNFLPDLFVECPECEGKRFNRQTLEVRYRGKSIADVLDMQVEEAAKFFENFPSILRPLESLIAVGLGYISLGQPSTTLSGGEAQRVKLASELCRSNTGNMMYILDEPTTGLHFEDIQRLLKVLHDLVELGNSVIVIEHNMDVITSADWIIDMGPEGGAEGGFIVATGVPAEVARVEESHTGRFLREKMAGIQ
ncbi:MAG: ATP-binding cassette domain-containing protein [Planctomycetia bacterium]|nr:ATP-binding cassette domain-containing protein [Planctomycetia bacterium]